MSEGIYLPSKLAEEIAEERAMQRRARADAAIPFHDTTLRIGGALDSSGAAHQPDALLREIRGWVAIGLRPIVDRLTGLEMRACAISDGEKADELAYNHPANLIVDQPNPIFSFADLLGLSAAWLKMTGTAYFQVVHDGLGVPRELWPMPPHKVYPVPDQNDIIGGYIVQGTNGAEQALEATEVIRVWKPDPLTMYQGVGDLAPQADTYNTELYRVAHLEQDFKHDSTPRLVFEPGEAAHSPTQEQRTEFQTLWRELNDRRQGSGRGIPAFGLPGFKLHELGRTNDTSGTVQLGDRTKAQLLAAIGTPGSIVGLVEDVNRAAAETNAAVFDRNTILPITKRIERSFTQQLAPQFDAQIVYKFREFQEADKHFELEREQSDLDKKVVSINEVREKRNLEPAPWGDEPVGTFSDVPYTGEPDFGSESTMDLQTSSTVASSSTTKFDEDEALTATNVLNGAQVSSIVDIVEAFNEGTLSQSAAIEIMSVSFGIESDSAKKMLSKRSRTRESKVTDEMRDAFSVKASWQRVIANERQFTRQFTAAMGKVFDTQRREVVKRLRKAVPVPRTRITSDDLFDINEWGLLFVATVRGLQEKIFLQNATKAFGVLQPADEFIFNEVVQRRLDEMHAAMVRQVNQTTKDRITQQLVEGQGKGESIDQLAKRIEGALINRKRARTIARTEVGKASQMGQLESFAQADLVERKEWHSSLDDDVRNSHRIDGKPGAIADLEGFFTLNNGVRAAHPLDPTLPAEDLINCRCFMLPVFEDDEE